MFGWHGRILRIDLSNGSIQSESVDPDVAKDYIGGRGWAIRYLYDEVDPKIDPLAPENKLIFATGPMTGTPAPTGNRYTIVTKSPLTGALSCSNSGGTFPTQMKKTGYDLFILEGCAAKPVYLWVHDGQAELRSAEHLWGMQVHETEDALLDETAQKAKVACIGPAGERLSRIAAVMNDKHRAAARSGVGAVMGSKNLKAVVVLGETEVTLAQPEKMKALSKMVRSEVLADVKKGSALREYGTGYVPPVTNELGILPTHNFQTGVFAHADKIDGYALKERFLKRPKACFGCPIACGRDTEVDVPAYAGAGEGPEYETMAALGSACGVSDLAALTKANYLCNELGLDTISTGATISCAMELYEKGLLPEGDAGGPLRFGDADRVIELVRATAYRQGLGDLLAEGSYRLASHYGAPELSITAKKLEFPGYDPRGAKGMGLLYATSNIGASHMAGDIAYMEVFGVPVRLDPLSTENKPAYVKHFEDIFAIVDAAGLCVFLAIRYLFTPDSQVRPERLAELMNLTTGAAYTVDTLLEAGDRVFTLERSFLVRAGFDCQDDTLPRRMLEEPLSEGPGTGHVADLDKMLPEFYRLRGWDADGIPTPEKMASLGLTD